MKHNITGEDSPRGGWCVGTSTATVDAGSQVRVQALMNVIAANSSTTCLELGRPARSSSGRSAHACRFHFCVCSCDGRDRSMSDGIVLEGVRYAYVCCSCMPGSLAALVNHFRCLCGTNLFQGSPQARPGCKLCRHALPKTTVLIQHIT